MRECNWVNGETVVLADGTLLSASIDLLVAPLLLMGGEDEYKAKSEHIKDTGLATCPSREQEKELDDEDRDA